MAEPPRKRAPVKAFISYSNRDSELLNQLLRHLQPLVREELLDLHHDQTLESGADWTVELYRMLSESQIVLFLVSPDSLASAFVEREVAQALSHQESKRIVPIVLRPCDWFSSPLAKFMALPAGGKPVTTWENRDEAFADITRGLRKLVDSLDQERDRSQLPSRHEGPVNSIAISADGRRVVSAGEDGTAIVWDALTLQPLFVLGHGEPVTAVSLTEDGQRAVSRSADSIARVWDLETGEPGNIQTDLPQPDVPSNVRTSSAVLPGGRYSVAAQPDGLKLLDLTSGTIIRSLNFGSETPTAVAVTPDGRRAIWGSSLGNVGAWPLDTSVARPLPEGRDRLRLAYLAVLESPELWRVLETWDESALSGIGAQLAIPPEEDVLETLTGRHQNIMLPPLWAAWMETLHRSKLAKAPGKP